MVLETLTAKKKWFIQSMEIKYKWSYWFYLKCKMKFKLNIEKTEILNYQAHLLNRL